MQIGFSSRVIHLNKCNKQNVALKKPIYHHFSSSNILSINTFQTYSLRKQHTKAEVNSNSEGSYKTIAVLGAGISGLSFAYSLLSEAKKQQKNIKVIMLEKQNRVGGWLKTTRDPKYGVIEEGPRSIRFSNQAYPLLKMIEEIGLSNQLIAGDIVNSKNRIIYAKDRFWSLPKSLSQFLTQFDLITKSSLFSILLKQLFSSNKYSETDDVSIHQFFLDHTNREFADYLIASMCVGIYAGDSKKLSMKSCFQTIFDIANQSGSIFRGMMSKSIQTRSKSLILRYKHEKQKKTNNDSLQKLENREIYPRISKSGIFSFKNGISTLPEYLIAHLVDHFRSNFSIHYQSSISEISISSNQPFIHLSYESIIKNNKQIGNQKNTVEIDYLVSALPSFEFANILASSKSPNFEHLQQLLNSIHFADVGVANFAFDKIISTPMNGFGYLIPPIENQPILGTTFDSQIFGDQNGSSEFSKFTFMFGGDHVNQQSSDLMKNVVTEKKGQLLNEEMSGNSVFHSIIKNQMKINVQPSLLQYFVHSKAIPQYHVGHSEKVEKIRNELQNVFSVDGKSRVSVIGNSYKGVGIVDCVNNSRNAAIDLINQL